METGRKGMERGIRETGTGRRRGERQRDRNKGIEIKIKHNPGGKRPDTNTA